MTPAWTLPAKSEQNKNIRTVETGLQEFLVVALGLRKIELT
jgi:hypothetical protein